MRIGVALLVGALVSGALGATDAWAQGASVTSATDAQKAEAKEIFGRGMQAFSDGRHDDAIVAFEDSWTVVRSPNTRLMIARALVKLDRRPEAHDEFVRVIGDAEEAAKSDDKYAKTAAAARDELKDLKKKLGFVTLTGTTALPDIQLRVGGRLIPRAGWTQQIPVTPGVVQIELGGKAVRELEVAAGASATVDLSSAEPSGGSLGSSSPDEDPILPPDEDTPREDTGGEPSFPKIPVGIAVAGVGVVGMTLYGVFGGLALSKKSELDDNCPNKQCPSATAETNYEEIASDGETYTTTANVMFGVGIAGLAVGGTLIVVGLLEDDGDPAGENESSEPAASLRIGPGSIGVEGVF